MPGYYIMLTVTYFEAKETDNQQFSNNTETLNDDSIVQKVSKNYYSSFECHNISDS